MSVALAAMVVATSIQAATIRDSAGMFSPEVVKKLEVQLDRLERATKIPVVIETLDSIPGIEKGASSATKLKKINDFAVKRDEALADEGIYLLISKNDHIFSPVLIRSRYAALLPVHKRDAIRDELLQEFEKRNFDGGLTRAVETIEQSLEGAVGATRPARAHGVVVGHGQAANLGPVSPPWEHV